MDICAGTLRSPLERDEPLLWPLRTGCGELHAHARRRASTRGRPLPKLRGKRVRHGRKRESRSAGAHRPSKRIAAFSAARGPAEPRRRRSRAGRHHRAPRHQTAHGNHTGDAQHCQLLGWKHGLASAIKRRRRNRGAIGGDQQAGARHTTLKKCPERPLRRGGRKSRPSSPNRNSLLPILASLSSGWSTACGQMQAKRSVSFQNLGGKLCMLCQGYMQMGCRHSLTGLG